MNFAWQRFHAAALALARSGTVKERLQRAYQQHLADLDASTLPAQLRGDFASWSRALTRERPLRGEDAVAATIRKLSATESDELAGSLIEMYGELSRIKDLESAEAHGGGVAAPSVTAVSGRVIPLFAEARS